MSEETVTLGFTPGHDLPVRIDEGEFTQVLMPIHRGNDKEWTVRFVAPEVQLIADAVAEEVAANADSESQKED